MTSFGEAIPTWLESLGYAVKHGPEVALAGPAAERVIVWII